MPNRPGVRLPAWYLLLVGLGIVSGCQSLRDVERRASTTTAFQSKRPFFGASRRRGRLPLHSESQLEDAASPDPQPDLMKEDSDRGAHRASSHGDRPVELPGLDETTTPTIPAP